MHCRAVLLLQREFDRLNKNELWGTDVYPNPENIFQWVATISGLKGTDWEGGIFRIRITFNEHFDEEWPEITFETIPFHPNIDPMNGKPCINIFDDETSSSKSVSGILLQLQALLSNPVLEKAVNGEAANLLHQSPAVYVELVRKCVLESQRIASHSNNFASFIENPKRVEIYVESPQVDTKSVKTINKLKQVSFDEYHKNWLHLGTSNKANTFIYSDESYSDRSNYGFLHEQYYSRAQSETPSASRAVEMDTELRINKMKNKKMQRLSEMKQLYLNKPTSANTEVLVTPVTSRTNVGNDGWDKEAEELVAWTASLNANEIP